MCHFYYGLSELFPVRIEGVELLYTCTIYNIRDNILLQNSLSDFKVSKILLLLNDLNMDESFWSGRGRHFGRARCSIHNPECIHHPPPPPRSSKTKGVHLRNIFRLATNKYEKGYRFNFGCKQEQQQQQTP